MVIFKCYFSGELTALSLKKYIKNKNKQTKQQQRCEHRIRRRKNRLKALCIMQINTWNKQFMCQ